MDYATIIKAGSKAARAVAKYIDKDLHTYYGLAKPAWASFNGPGVGILGRSLEIGQIVVGVLSVEFVSPDRVRLSAIAFAAAAKLWNGPNGIPDNLNDGSFEMSLWHDLIWEYARMIAEVLGCTEQDVMAWGDGILSAAYVGYGRKAGARAPRLRARVAFNVCEWSRRWWRKVFPGAVCVLVAMALLAGCSGCKSPPPWELEDASEIEVAAMP